MRSNRSPIVIVLTVILSAAGMAWFQADAVPADDYLAPDLRAQVEQLKKDVASTPTNDANKRQRAAVLWRWANAFALNGGRLPVETQLSVGVSLSYAKGIREDGLWRQLDNHIRELTLREHDPDALGTLTSETDGPFTAGSYQTIRHTYTVGDHDMRPGGAVIVAVHFMADASPRQFDDPAAEGYISVSSSNPRARFVPSERTLGGMHGGFFESAMAPAFELRGATLKKGDTVTVTYGDRSGGSPGYMIQSYSNDAYPLPLYVTFEEDGHTFSLPIPTYRVVGQPIEAVRALAPSVVGVNEPFSLTVRSEDGLFNRASGPVPRYEVLQGDRIIARVPVGDEALSWARNLKISQPGVYRLTVRSDDGRFSTQSNPIRVTANPTRRVYWGETHGHSAFAEGQGTPDAFMRFGRDDARLDFLTHSEHDLWMDDFEWGVLVDNTKKFNQEGEFITFLGYEWTQKGIHGGHHNVLFRTPDGRERVPVQEAPYLSSLYQGLGEQNDMRDVLVIPHAHEPGDWRLSHPEMETLVEIM
ncbi:MAG: DUF3604 domain-containing protein, partial [Planctomycetota bacterium]